MPISRSGRRSGARKSYADDPFQAIGLEESEDGENTKHAVGPSGEENGKAKKRKRESDDEFDEQAAASPEEESNDDEDEGIENVASKSDEPGQDEEEEPVRSVTVNRSSAAGGNRAGRYRERKVDGSLRFLPQETHSRGVYNPSEHVSKSMHIKLSFGLDDRDLLALVNARSRWSTGIDSIFPTRASLDKGPKAIDYGPGNTHGVYAADLEREATTGWDWYYNNQHGSNFRKRQRLEPISETQAQQKFLFMPTKNSLKVIYGPGDCPADTQLQHHESINFGNAWKNRDETHKVGKKDASKKKGKKKTTGEAPDDELTEDEPSTKEPRRKNRYGWFLNVSGKIQALAWAPNQSDMTQYLAISVPINSEQERQYNNTPGPPKVSPAFSPSPPYPGAIQIWSFNAEEREKYITKTLDAEQKPKLNLVLCMEFGHIRKLNWCSIPRKKRKEDEEGNTRSLGLLACVFSDGRTRILDVKVNKKSETTEYRTYPRLTSICFV
jgi:transcription factor C subunit 6